jgi:hypothetical protein
MVHLIMGIKIGFWVLRLLFLQKFMLCNIILIIIINSIPYIEGFMNIFIIYIGITRPLFRFDYINFKASLVIKIINYILIKKWPI